MLRLIIPYALLCIACGLFVAWSGRTRFTWSVQLALFFAVSGFGGWGLARFADAKRHNSESDAARKVVAQFLSLPLVHLPSEVSEYWTVRSTQRFEDAPIRIVEFADPLCVDCRVFIAQMKQLKKDFAGKINVAFQFFPLEARCNDVVEKDRHSGACDLSYMLAADTSKFVALHDEIYANMDSAKLAPWRLALAERFGVAWALSDTATQRRVHRLIQTGREYGRTSDKYSYGIRSTPTMIVNGRMLIGTLPIEHMRAIMQALVDAHGASSTSFMENWLEPGCVIGSAAEVKQCKAE
jgi:hypothetical protein